MSNYCSLQDAWSISPFGADLIAHPSPRYQHSPQPPLPSPMITPPQGPLPLGTRTYARAINSSGPASRINNYTPHQSPSSGVSNVNINPLFPLDVSPTSRPSQTPSAVASDMLETFIGGGLGTRADHGQREAFTDVVQHLKDEIAQLRHLFYSRPGPYATSQVQSVIPSSHPTLYDVLYYIMLGVCILYALLITS
jgi:hypothetical protein